MDGRRGSRPVVLGALAAVLVLLAFGPAAPPAAAQTRQEARAEANDFIA